MVVVSEVVYYDAVVAEIVSSLTMLVLSSTRAVVLEPEKLHQKQQRALSRLPKALDQLRSESNKLASSTSNEKSERSFWTLRILLYQCFANYLQETGQVFIIPLLVDSSVKLRYLLEKTMFVLEEHEAVLHALPTSDDLLMNVLRANLALHVEEAYDVQRLDESLLSEPSLSSASFLPTQIRSKDPLAALKALHCSQSASDDDDSAIEHVIAFFLAYVERIARQCDIRPKREMENSCEAAVAAVVQPPTVPLNSTDLLGDQTFSTVGTSNEQTITATSSETTVEKELPLCADTPSEPVKRRYCAVM